MLRLPHQAPGVNRSLSTRRTEEAIKPSGCDFWTAAECAGEIAACAATCIGAPEACVPCILAMGGDVGKCLSCVT